MGGNATQMPLPVASYSGVSTWNAHINRGTPSSEPGADLYCPIGTPLRAPADGVIWGSGNSINPATGRWVGIDFDNGMGYRTMHHSVNLITSGRVSQGDVYALSGASGYGEEDWSWNVAETGGAHVHVTLWPTHDHRYGYRAYPEPYTIDPQLYMDGTGAEMNAEEWRQFQVLAKNVNEIKEKVNPTFDAIFRGGKSMPDGGRSIGASLADIVAKIGPIYRGGKAVSVRQEIADIKTTVYAQNAAFLGMEAALQALATAKGFDPAAVLVAAQTGVENGLSRASAAEGVDG